MANREEEGRKTLGQNRTAVGQNYILNLITASLAVAAEIRDISLALPIKRMRFPFHFQIKSCANTLYVKVASVGGMVLLARMINGDGAGAKNSWHIFCRYSRLAGSRSMNGNGQSARDYSVNCKYLIRCRSKSASRPQVKTFVGSRTEGEEARS